MASPKIQVSPEQQQTLVYHYLWSHQWVSHLELPEVYPLPVQCWCLLDVTALHSCLLSAIEKQCVKLECQAVVPTKPLCLCFCTLFSLKLPLFYCDRTRTRIKGSMWQHELKADRILQHKWSLSLNNTWYNNEKGTVVEFHLHLFPFEIKVTCVKFSSEASRSIGIIHNLYRGI